MISQNELNKYNFISFITNICGRQLSYGEIESTFDYISNMENKNVFAETEINNLLSAMQTGQKIESIKAYRTLVKVGLKEAKDIIEKYWTYPPNQHPNT